MTSPRAPLVAATGLAKRFGASMAVEPTDLSIAEGDFVSILGPSGCGKTTLLRMIAGLTPPSAGRIAIDGVDVTRLGAERRPTNMVFQGYGLFPHMDVAENVGFGLSIARRPAEEIARRSAEALALVRMEAFARRPVETLSGGQKQRVALARALVMRPRVLLLDEPLAALDLKLRQAMQEELRRIHKATGGTFVMVTHDQTEAFALSNRIAVMEAGRIVQDAAPTDLYRRPASLFVAGFVGEINRLAGARRAGRVTLACGLAFADAGPDGEVVAVIRPEAVRIAPEGEAGVPATLRDAVFEGAAIKLALTLASGETLSMRAMAAEATPVPEPGGPVRLALAAEAMRIFAP
jgi:ABC-type Fe3+/spermidine/putrescine transport system ATPase subunit